MAMKQHWMVIPIDLKYDQRAGPLMVQEALQADRQPEPVEQDARDDPARLNLEDILAREPRNRFQPAPAQRNRRGNQDDQGRPVGTRYGWKLDRESQKQIDNCFEIPELAEKYAAELASQHPGKQYGIFTCIRVFETTTPQVITKKFTEAGELALEIKE